MGSGLQSFGFLPGEAGQGQRVHFVESSPKDGGLAKLHSRKYPLPGDPFMTFELNWFELLQTSKTRDQGLIDFRWPVCIGPGLTGGNSITSRSTGVTRGRQDRVRHHHGEHRNVIDETSDTPFI